MKTLKDIKRELLADPAARTEYEAQAAEFDMARELIPVQERMAVREHSHDEARARGDKLLVLSER